MAVAYPTVVYGQNSSVSNLPRLIRNKMGDGNQQVIKDGINHINLDVTLEHPLLESSDATTLRSFLQTYTDGTVVSIIDYMQDYTGATTMNVVLLGWDENFDGVTYTFTVKAEKVFRTS